MKVQVLSPAQMNKLLVILGPTATGKSGLAVKLAKKYKGEVISADLRQVYKGLDIGTGKITKKEMRGIHHWLIDVENPKKIFTVAEWQKMADEKIQTIAGFFYLILAGFSHFAQQLFPIITFIAASTGAVLGCHGVYVLIKNKIKHTKEKYFETHYTGDM